MSKIGILTEKPSARKNFEKAFNKKIGNDTIVISNSVGHVFEYVEPHEMVEPNLQKKYKSWAVSNLPWDINDLNWKQKITKGKSDVVKKIKSELKNCDEIIIATDSDSSGEGYLIGAEILLNTGLYKNKKITRMTFYNEDAKTLINSFENRTEIKNIENNTEYKKALFRSKWDYLSMQMTRAATSYAPKSFVIRTGRLKGLMVDLVGKAIEENENYVEIPYYQNKFKDENGIIYSDSNAEKYDFEDKVPTEFKSSKVIKNKPIEKSTLPPQLLDIATLSGILAPKGIKAGTLKNTYQKLYEAQYISYPRTDDKKITLSQFNELLPLVDDIAKLVGVDPSILTHRKPRPTHVSEIGSHGANRPGLVVPKSMEQIKKMGYGAELIYKTITRSFLAILCEDYIYEHQSGYLEDYPSYKGSVNIAKSLGWKNVYVSDDDDETIETVGLGTIAEPFIYKGANPKPPVPTVSWLMKSLKKYNVGTGSTRNSTFAEISSPQSKTALFQENRGKISLTDHGFYAKQIIKNTNIAKPETSESVIQAMKAIDEGNEKLSQSVLSDFVNIINEDIKTMASNKENFEYIKFEVKEKITFELDGKEVSFSKSWGGHDFTEEEIEKLINGETIEIRGLKNKRGKTYGVRGNLQWQKFKNKTFYGFKMLEFINDKE